MSAKCDKHSLMIRMLLIKEEAIGIRKRVDNFHFHYQTPDGATVLIVVPYEDQPGFAVNEMDFAEMQDSDLIRFARYGGDQLDDHATILIETLRDRFTKYRPHGPKRCACRILTNKQVQELRQMELL